ncbi:MAG: Fic family protein [Fusobacteriota bacterium]
MNESIQLLDKLPISNRLIKKAHEILLKTGRGENKSPGEFRKNQNWIGGSNLNNAMYITPHNEYLEDLMADLELFINEENNIPHLIKIAMMHYQFEVIHPFLDGNGRVGRLLITLYLVDKGLLNKPALYLSDYLEKFRSEYYMRLTKTRVEDDIVQWIKFFLRGIIKTAQITKNNFVEIIKLKEKLEEEAKKFGSRSEKIDNVINEFYERPIMTIKDIVETTGVPDSTSRKLVKDMIESGILKEITGYGRNKKYVLYRYLNIFE